MSWSIFLIILIYYNSVNCLYDYTYSLTLSETDLYNVTVYNSISVVIYVNYQSNGLAQFKTNVYNLSPLHFSMYANGENCGIVSKECYFNLEKGESLNIKIVKFDLENNLLSFSYIDSASDPQITYGRCPVVFPGTDYTTNCVAAYENNRNIDYGNSDVGSLTICANIVTSHSSNIQNDTCMSDEQWWEKDGSFTAISTMSTAPVTSHLTPTPTTPSNNTLRHLANQGVGLNNVTEVLNTTYTYSILGQNLSSSQIVDITTILNNSANLFGISAENSVQILSNIDCVMNANDSELKNSTQNLFQIYGNMVHNTNDTRIEYLSGTNLGFSSKRVDCQNLGVDDGLIDLGSTFQSINRSLNMQSTLLNGIMIPLNAICQSTDLTHIFFTIYRDRKLFIGKKRRIFASHNQYTEDYIIVDEDDEDPPSRCVSQIALTSNTPVLCATVMNDGEEISRITTDDNDNNIMANLQFNIKKIPNPLHGKFEVTWWNTSLNQWASDNFCKITKKTDDLITAECPHLTDFTIIVVGTLDDQAVCDSTLATIGYVVNSFSIVSLLFLTAISVLVFIQTSTIRRLLLIIKGQEINEGDLVIVFYYSSLLLFYFIFVFFSHRANETSRDIGCIIVAALMYFLLLCSIMLNIVQGVRIINTFFSGRFSKFVDLLVSPFWALVICIGCPALLCLLLATLDSPFFERNDSFCWIRPDYIISAIVIPISILLLNASVCTMFVTYKMFYSPRRILSNKKVKFYDAEFWSKILAIFIMELSLGAPWIVQYFTIAWPDTIFWNYLFTIVFGSQGTILLVIFLYRRHRVYQDSIRKSKFSSSSSD